MATTQPTAAQIAATKAQLTSQQQQLQNSITQINSGLLDYSQVGSDAYFAKTKEQQYQTQNNLNYTNCTLCKSILILIVEYGPNCRLW